MTEDKVRNAHKVALECASEPSVIDHMKLCVYQSVFSALLTEPVPPIEDNEDES